MESQADKLYNSFLDAGNTLAALYRAAESAQTEAFTKGQKDTLNEIIQYVLKESGGDPRKMTTNKLLEYLDIKLREVQANVPENNMPLQTPSQTSEIPNIMELGLQSPSMNNTWNNNQGGFPEGFQTRQLNEEVMNMGNQNQGNYGNQQNQFDNNHNNQAVFAGGHVDADNAEVYNSFISLATPNNSATEPYIGVVTAGVSLPIAEKTANEIISHLQNYGAQKVEWLPYHPDNGSTCMSTAWNENLEKMTGIFFNGGSPQDLIKCFREDGKKSPALKIIEERYKKGDLAIYGSSAGSLIWQATPIIEMQDSWDALVRQPLYMKEGGLGLFDHGFLDVHFTQRGRHGSFARLVFDLQNKKNGKIGFGVDENTAMVMQDNESFKVVGEGGVYIIDVSSAKKKSGEEKSKRWSVEDVRVFYLTEGDSFNFKTKHFKFAQGKVINNGIEKHAEMSKDIFSDEAFTKVTTDLFNSNLSESTYGLSSETKARYRLNFRKTSVSEGLIGEINGTVYQSYANLFMDIYCVKNC